MIYPAKHSVSAQNVEYYLKKHPDIKRDDKNRILEGLWCKTDSSTMIHKDMVRQVFTQVLGDTEGKKRTIEFFGEFLKSEKHEKIKEDALRFRDINDSWNPFQWLRFFYVNGRRVQYAIAHEKRKFGERIWS